MTDLGFEIVLLILNLLTFANGILCFHLERKLFGSIYRTSSTEQFFLFPEKQAAVEIP